MMARKVIPYCQTRPLIAISFPSFAAYYNYHLHNIIDVLGRFLPVIILDQKSTKCNESEGNQP